MKLLNEDVVISGIGGYFPKSSNVDEFKSHLINNENLLETRWKNGERGVTNLIGKIRTDNFDNTYFGIHRVQCSFMDPMQRLILERTFEALIDAGVNPSEVRGKRVGCFMASAIGENDNLFLESIISGFGVTGHSRAMMPNRVSYWLNLKGPSVAYDSNWMGGMEVLRIAFESIKSGQCDSAFVGCANLALNSEFQWLYNDMGLLSPDGSTRSFDADANGYARSDGVVVLYIQRASDARRSYASIVNVATRFNGMREGNLHDVDVPSMVEFMNDFYQRTGVDPKDVEFVEAYGGASKETDKKEVAALKEVYCKNRKEPLLIGSVKANTGHSEATTVLFSIVKVLIAMETQTIPATIQFDKPNPEISALIDGTIRVVQENLCWKGEYAAVNAIGIDSYYGHILFKSNQKKKMAKQDDLPRLALASTRTEEGMKGILERIKSKSDVDPEYIKLIQDLYSRPILGHLYRGYVVLGKEIRQQVEYHLGNQRQIWFVYSGMGSQWAGMASDLMKLPIFANAINKCHNVLMARGINLLEIITSNDKSIFDNILHSFVGIAAIQIGLTDILHAIGLKPDGIIGHSVGELGCAYADGCLTAEQMILAAYSRGRASLEADLIQGMMAAIGIGYQEIKDKCPPTIEVACHNGPDSSTISGPTEDMEKFVKQLQDLGLFARLVNVSNIAYHSSYIKPAAPYLLKYLKEVIAEPVPRSAKWISTSNPEDDWDTDLAKTSSAEYHTNNLLSSVLFEEGLKHIPKDSVLIEIAPHGLLQAILKRSLKSGCTNVPLTQRNSKSGVEFLLSAIGKLYLAGLNVNVSTLYPEIKYPVSRGTPGLGNLVSWEHSETWRTGLEDKLKSLFGVRDFHVTLNSEEFRDCIGHQLDDNIILPCSYYLNIVYNIITNISAGNKDVIFENINFKKMLTIPKIGSVFLHAMIQKGTGDFEIVAESDVIVTGRMTFPLANDRFLLNDIDVKIGDDNVQLTGNDIYNELQHRGHKYSGHFKTIKSLTIAEEGSVAHIQWNNKWSIFLEAMIQQQLLQAGERNQQIFVPKTIQKIVCSQNILPAEKTDLKTTFNYSTGLISAKGIQIIGLRTIPYAKNVKTISFDSMEFTPLIDPQISTIELCLNVALQLTLSNFEDQYVTNIMVTEIDSNNPSLLEDAKNVLKQYTKINANITTIKDPSMVIVQKSYPVLVIYNDFIQDDLVEIVGSSHCFLLVRTDKQLLSHPQIVEVAQYSIKNQSYSIVRKMHKEQPSVVIVKSDTLSIKDLAKNANSWVNELVTSAKSRQSRVFLISSIIPIEGIANFAQELMATPEMSRVVRIVFILDNHIKEISTTNPFYQEIFKKDLTLSVYKDGVLGSYLPVPINIKPNINISTDAASNIMKNLEVHCLGLNLKEETFGVNSIKRGELGNFDYSGITNHSGHMVMGIAKMDHDLFKLIPDPILSWSVPKYWDLENAATVPHAYISAYYTLFIKANLKASETVLIHGGCSPIGYAAIMIALFHGCSVYTTCSTDSQKAFLLKQITSLKGCNILNSDSTNFQPLLLMATRGVGAHVVLNCLSGTLLQTSICCLAEGGRFIHIGKYDLQENNSIAMGTFLRNTSFTTVILEDIFSIEDDLKEKLRNLIQDGIVNWRVYPLMKKIVDFQNIDQVLCDMNKSTNIGKTIIKLSQNSTVNKLFLGQPNQFICEPRNSYLLYGGSSDLWMNTVEWLVLRGARKVVVSFEHKPQQNHINRRLTLLQSYYGAEIIFAPIKANTCETAAELLSEVYFLGPIHAVFILPNKSSTSKIGDIKPIQYIDHALRTTAPKARLVNFVANASGICDMRSKAGFPTHNIQWEKDLDFGAALGGLDVILGLHVDNIFIKNDKISDSTQDITQGLFKKLTLMLPCSIEAITEEVKLAPLKPDLVQIPTIGPSDMRELAPVFIIPGISGIQEALELGYKLLYPAFYAVLPSSSFTIQEIATDLVEKMKTVWPKGPYNIVGISWGGGLAVEIARILNEEGTSLHLYFIDGAPSTLQAALKHLGEDVASLETNLLTRILNINDAELVARINQLPNWNERTQLALDHCKKAIKHRNDLEDSLTVLKSRLEGLLELQPTEDLISGQIHLIRPIGSSKYDNCGLVSYCKQTPQITLVNGDHLSIINNPATAEYINERHYVI